VNVNKILIGNKSDCHYERCISYAEGDNLAKEYNIHFFETSAKEIHNVEPAFLALATEVKNRLEYELEYEKSEREAKNKPEKERLIREAAQNLENEKSIKEALAQGRKEWRRSKIMIVGEGRAGKTALANSILGRAYEDHDSTIGINEFTCSIGYASSIERGKGEDENESHKNTWSELLDQKSLKEVETAVASMIFDQKSGKTKKRKSQEASEEPSTTPKGGISRRPPKLKVHRGYRKTKSPNLTLALLRKIEARLGSSGDYSEEMSNKAI
jgi:hypothetical protein